MAVPAEFVPRKGADFEYADEVDPLLLCGLCKGALYQPQETECEHYFCRMCVEGHLAKQGACPVCPSCSEPLSLKTPFKKVTKLVKLLTGKLKVRCNRIAHDKICGHVYPRDDFNDHAKVCNHRQIPCPRCNESIYRGDLQKHEVTCTHGGGFSFTEEPKPEPRVLKSNSFTQWSFTNPTSTPVHAASGMDVDSPGKGFAFAPPSGLSDLRTPPLQDEVKFEIGTSKSAKTKRPKHTRRLGNTYPHPADVTMGCSQSPPPTPSSPRLPPFSDEKKPTQESKSATTNMWASDFPIQSTPVQLPVPSPERRQPSPPKDSPPSSQPPGDDKTAHEGSLSQGKKKESMRRGSKEKTSKKLKMMGDDAYEKGDYDTAIEMWTQAVDLDDGTTKLTVVYGNRSAARFMSQQYNECIADCKLALEEDRTNAKLWNRMAKAACSMGKIDLAIMLLKSAMQDTKLKEKGGKEFESVERELLSCHTVQRAITTSERYLQDDKIPEAEAELNTCIAKYGDWPQVIVALSKMFIKKKLPDQALGIIDKPLAVASVKPSALDSSVLVDALHVKCTALYLKGFDKMKDAIKVAQDGLAISPDNKLLAEIAQRCRALEEKKEKGNEKFRGKEWVKSAQLYSEGLELASDCPEIAKVLHTNRAAARKEMKQYKLAVDDCTSALEYDPKFARAYTRRGRCHIELNDFEKAIADFKAAQRIGGPSQDLTDMLRDAERRKDSKSDFYSLLGASHSFSNSCEKTMKELKTKYKELCLRWHPDKIHSGSEEERKEAEKKIKQINEAYATLTDPQKRREYDKTLFLKRSNSANFAHTFGSTGHYGQSRFGAGYGYSSYGGL
eukprot:TRINITY_DN6642_c0_g1_i1.p1 TRINITY_DN6642_c0_g1~~TRINITY_DN6642_c0_g1_i1.p1  ORF type:complete len:839 (+),score=234.09 TRINITY_DN6642_c0_g1_i1:116-2632(+)